MMLCASIDKHFFYGYLTKEPNLTQHAHNLSRNKYVTSTPTMNNPEA